MKCFYFLTLLFGYVYCWGRGDLEKYGPFQRMLNSKLIKCDHSRTLNRDVSGINIYFYDFANDFTAIYPVKTAAEGILNVDGIDLNRQFIVVVPGYKTNMRKKTVEKIQETFRSYPKRSYLIIIDHSKYTNDNDGFIKSYERSVTNVYYIGKALAEMLAGLKKGGVSTKNMHCIGHSLGSQILGQTGEIFNKLTGDKVARITALDPAGPCFSNSFIQEQVRSGVAQYVEVYHCNAGALGTSSVLGDVDFFVNHKGTSQPDCGTPWLPGIFDSSKAASCNHRSCINMYLATVNDPELFTAYKCDNYKDFKNGYCTKNDHTVAGYWNPGTAKGVYYLSTGNYKLI